MLKVVEAYLISYLISPLSTLLSATTWTNHQSREVIHSSWTLHVVVVPRNLGYRKPTTTCDCLCFMLYVFKHETERFALERDYYILLYSCPVCSGSDFGMLLCCSHSLRRCQEYPTAFIEFALSGKSAALLSAVGKLKLQLECISHGSRTTLGFRQSCLWIVSLFSVRQTVVKNLSFTLSLEAKQTGTMIEGRL